MSVVIVSCSLTGQFLARRLVSQGVDVVIIDKDFASLDDIENLDCPFIQGSGTDPETLESAGIMDCDAFFALDKNENYNVVSAQFVRNFYGIKKVFALTSNPENEIFYASLGVYSISSTSLAVEAGLNAITQDIQEG